MTRKLSRPYALLDCPVEFPTPEGTFHIVSVPLDNQPLTLGHIIHKTPIVLILPIGQFPIALFLAVNKFSPIYSTRLQSVLLAALGLLLVLSPDGQDVGLNLLGQGGGGGQELQGRGVVGAVLAAGSHSSYSLCL